MQDSILPSCSDRRTQNTWGQNIRGRSSHRMDGLEETGHGGVLVRGESGVGSDLCGDTGILGFWDPSRICVFNVCVVETDTASYDGRHLQKILSKHELRKKGKCIEACLERQCHFMPLVLSVDGVTVRDKSQQQNN